MYEFRNFHNADPPHLAAIWQSQPPQRAMAQPMSAALLETYVLSRPHFDPCGLIVATADGTPVGFAHAGWGPTEQGDRIDVTLGTTHGVWVHPLHAERQLAPQLLARSEAYLRSRGTKVLYGGGIRPLDSFYYGLYGGSELPGILDSDLALQQLFTESGYRAIDRVVVMHRELGGFRAPVSWKLRQCLRVSRVDCIRDPLPSTWWEACTTGGLARTQFVIAASGGGPKLGSALFWDVEPLATSWGLTAAGLLHVDIASTHRRQGLATLLLSRAMCDLREQGVNLVEAQTMQNNTPSLALLRGLGFVEVDRGTIFRKETQEIPAAINAPKKHHLQAS